MQIQSTNLAFDDFSHLLIQADSLANPAEIHGILCGLICTGQKLDGKFWLHTVLKLFEAKAHISPRHRGRVIELYAATCRQLSDLDDSFKLLLPDQEQPLACRAEALSQWCYGFLYGLKLTDSSLVERSNQEVRDALKCISEIAKLDFSNIEVRDIDNNAYVGVVEYVRSAVVAVYQELAGNTRDDSSKTQQKNLLH